MSSAISLETLPLTYLALFVGQRANEIVTTGMHAAGYGDVRPSHGYVFQHLVDGGRSISEVGERLGISQQAASKTVAELVALGYLERHVSEDKRMQHVALSRRGRDAVNKARALRATLERGILRRHGQRSVEATRRLLLLLLSELGGAEAVRTRRLREPDAAVRTSAVRPKRARPSRRGKRRRRRA